MRNSIAGRLVIALAMLVVAIYFIAPTLYYFNLDAESLKEVRQKPETFRSKVPALFGTSHIVPGLDLQGGVSMVLGIDLDKALSDKTRRVANRMRNELENEKVDFNEVKHVINDSGLDRVVASIGASGVDAFEDLLDDGYPDLQLLSESGGEYTFRLQDDYVRQIRTQTVDQTRQTVQKRIDALGVTEPRIELRGSDQIQIQLPGYDNPEEAKNLIGRTAQLEFQMLDESSPFLSTVQGLPSYATLLGGGPGATITFPEDKLEDMQKFFRGKVPSGLTVKFGDYKEGELQTYLLKSNVELTGDDLSDAQVAQGTPTDPKPYVSLEFTPAGGKLFGDLTTKNVGKRMAIVLEDKVNSAPNITQPILGGRASITMGGGGNALREAKDLAFVLKSGALPAPVQFREERTVGASLGDASVNAGKLAAMIGVFAIFAFMAIYYRIAGLIAIIGLVFNISFVLAFLSMVGGTVTLPGLAGLLLTVGMAVDANIIIIERIREELRNGKRARAAVSAGYDHAYSAIVDANITTFIAAIVLLSFGTGLIKNFATLLAVGTVSSVVSAVFITRIFFDFYVRNNPEKVSV